MERYNDPWSEGDNALPGVPAWRRPWPRPPAGAPPWQVEAAKRDAKRFRAAPKPPKPPQEEEPLSTPLPGLMPPPPRPPQPPVPRVDAQPFGRFKLPRPPARPASRRPKPRLPMSTGQHHAAAVRPRGTVEPFISRPAPVPQLRPTAAPSRASPPSYEPPPHLLEVHVGATNNSYTKECFEK